VSRCFVARDVGALVLGHQLLHAIFFQRGGALTHDSVVGPVELLLQRQAGPGVDNDLLDLPALPLSGAVAGAPMAIDGAVGLALRGPRRLVLVHDRLHVLGPVGLLQLRQHGAGPEREHDAVPGEATAGEALPSTTGAGLEDCSPSG
jgi:hypothetical protein